MAEYRGWAFPVQVDQLTGHVNEVAGEMLIAGSIRLILTTRRGERLLQPDFGCDLYTFMFSPLEYTTLKQMEKEAERSILAWEKRIRDLIVTAEKASEDTQYVYLDVAYKIGNLEEEFHYRHKVEMG